MKISYSSAQTYLGCKRKFYYEKVVGYPYDSDYEEDTSALRLGKGFHAVLEYCKHEKQNLKSAFYVQAFDENEIFSDKEKGYVYAMVAKYLKLHKKSGLTSIAEEIKITDDDFVGYVDPVMIDDYGNWWITDLKTAGRLSPTLLARLNRDQQLSIYAFYRDQISELLGLYMDNFRGVRYRVTTKPSIKMGKGETLVEFVKRCYERVEAYDIGVPVKFLADHKTYESMMRLLDEMRELETTSEEEVPQNFGYCEQYFKPCPFWSRCYGSTFSRSQYNLKMYDSANIPNLTIDDLGDL